ncbi:hypothetical protein [Dickeya zeae]|uniref:hypothetical protein n=1 Tax=Dickeya zeae TaxID=204042 RepID=UPI001F0E598E|nr:hypothetical protein [Dickeya zeae]
MSFSLVTPFSRHVGFNHTRSFTPCQGQDLHALNIAAFDEQAVAQWLRGFPGGLDVGGVQ